MCRLADAIFLAWTSAQDGWLSRLDECEEPSANLDRPAEETDGKRENFTEVNGGSEDDRDHRRGDQNNGSKQCGHPCANKDARQAEPLRALLHEGSPLHTLTPRLAAAALDAARHATGCDASAYHAASAMTGAAAPGIGVLAVIIVIILVMTGLARAARSLAALVSELLRVATAVTSVLLTTVIAIFLGIAFLVH
jgi:hypothetical protein